MTGAWSLAPPRLPLGSGAAPAARSPPPSRCYCETVRLPLPYLAPGTALCPPQPPPGRAAPGWAAARLQPPPRPGRVGRRHAHVRRRCPAGPGPQRRPRGPRCGPQRAPGCSGSCPSPRRRDGREKSSCFSLCPGTGCSTPFPAAGCGEGGIHEQRCLLFLLFLLKESKQDYISSQNTPKLC